MSKLSVAPRQIGAGKKESKMRANTRIEIDKGKEGERRGEGSGEEEEEKC